MADTLEIEQTDDELLIRAPSRAILPTFWRQFRAPFLAFSGLAAAAFGFGLWIGAQTITMALVVAGYFVATLGLIGAGLYSQMRSFGTPAELRLDGDAVHLEIGGDTQDYPVEAIQMLQASEMPTSSRQGQKPAAALPGNERWELTLLTEDDMTVVARALDRNEAEQAAERFHEQLPN